MPTLGYWGIRGLAQPIRLVLVYADIKFEDKLYSLEGGRAWPEDPQWLVDREALGLDFPNLPYWIEEESGLRLTQSHAILQHVARRGGLDGSTPEMAATVLMLLELSREIRDPYVNLSYGREFEAKKGAFIDTLEAPLAKLEAFAAKSGAFLCGEFTYVDLVWADLIEQLLCLAPDCLAACPTLQAHQKAVWALPKIAAYRASPACIDHPYNNPSASFR